MTIGSDYDVNPLHGHARDQPHTNTSISRFGRARLREILCVSAAAHANGFMMAFCDGSCK